MEIIDDGDITLLPRVKNIQLPSLNSAEWIEQYHTENEQKANDGSATTTDGNTEYLNKVEEELGAAGTWVNEFVKENPSSGITLAFLGKYSFTYINITRRVC